ncbi:MAG: LegC family aminotransferase [bacterium]
MIALSEPNICGNEWKYVKECLDTGWVSSAGKFVDSFENKICEYTGSRYAVACMNGTSALQISLQLVGVRSNDEVLVPTIAFIATINAVKYLNADPVFMDCDEFMNLDAQKLREFCSNECVKTERGLKNKKTGKIIKAVLPVHMYGSPCDMHKIMSVAEEFRLKIVEDAAESLGSYYTAGLYNNRFTGAIGDCGVYSFNGNKIITAGGGGMIVTNDEGLAKKARYYTNQAKDDPLNYKHDNIGYNFRLTNIHAAIGLAQLEKIEEFISIKIKNYEYYKRGLADIDGIILLDSPRNTRSNYWMYSIVVDKDKYGMDKELLMHKLKEKGIETRPIWYPNHLQKPYNCSQCYSITKAFYFLDRVLNIPCSTNLTEYNINTVIAVLKGLKKS